MSRIAIWISRYLLGITFIFSGFVKGIDPLGSAYKFGDYFAAFGMDFFMPLTVPMSFVLCAAELFIGLLLLMNVRIIAGIWGAFLFMLVFTPLTLYIAIYNPVADCGCFGDALIMTNWETFFKNLPLMGAATYLFYMRKRISTFLPTIHDIVAAGILLILSFLPSIHGYRNLPLMDFRPYYVGANIPESMAFPPDAPVDEYKTILYYEKDGVVKEFTQDNFPWQDTTWKFFDSESILVKEGYTPPISDFALNDYYGWDQTDSILFYPGYFLLAISYRLDDSKTDEFNRLNELSFLAKEQEFGFACVTSSPPSEVDRFVGNTGVAFPFLFADEIMLKTVIRSNPGLVLLNEGTILAKWHHRNIPEDTFFQGNLIAKSLSMQGTKNQTAWIYFIILALLTLKLSLIALYKFTGRDK